MKTKLKEANKEIRRLSCVPFPLNIENEKQNSNDDHFKQEKKGNPIDDEELKIQSQRYTYTHSYINNININTYTYTNTHTHMYSYMYMNKYL